ncbi:MAG: 50S ribosomal protein L23 [Firmicutes bacterium]|nr:50S ribosomal protein L23 [Bacillota bacterium]
MNLYDIIIKPILSERAFEGIKNKNYAFRVHPDATKDQIKMAVEHAFKGVVVESVNTANYKGKEKRQGRHVGKTAKWKKAWVQLTKDSKPIEFFEGLQ